MSVRLPGFAPGLVGVAFVALLGSSSASCGSPRACGEGTRLEGDTCVPVGPSFQCGAGTVLVDGRCIVPGGADGGCVPACTARECGDDGCGGSCGSCTDPEKPTCNDMLGRCFVECVPDCVDRECGDDGCDGSCGDCDEGDACESNGRCVPEAWTCDAAWYGADGTCDCGCGAADADCAEAGAPVAGCDEGETCNAAGACVSAVPAGWTCAPAAYDARDACNCGCGVPDPDCADGDLPLLGCNSGVTACNTDGSCGTCVSDCTGKQCGTDGCGNVCGMCTGVLSACREGTCVNPCVPLPLKCEFSTCGDDGCGGSCGSCGLGFTCTDGQCLRDTTTLDPASCVGRCGSQAPAGCYCTPGCAESGLCCQDFDAACACTPACEGKECGDDLCNGSCGTCTDPVRKFCGADGRCTDACTPRCDGRECGDNGCGGTCGTCGSGESCTYLGQCLPSAWQCDPFLYGDALGCDCGCGAPDPDCAASDATVFNCPARDTACRANGTCDATLCNTDAACPTGRACSGVYDAGGGRFGGTCAAQLPDGFPLGFNCRIDAECASSNCVDGRCRRYCQQDDQCPSAQLCVGLPVVDPVTRILRGTAPMCDGVGTGTACTSQASCTTSGEKCIAVVDAQSLAPRHVCALVLASALGQSCRTTACPDGYMCATVGSERRCTLPCPGGAADCPSGFRCGSVPFPLSGTSSPPSLPACVPN